MRYYQISKSEDKFTGRPTIEISFIVKENKIKHSGDEKIRLYGELVYSGYEKSFKKYTLKKINVEAESLNELYEFKNQVRYLEREVEEYLKEEKPYLSRDWLKSFKDVYNYLKQSNKFEEVIYDKREQSYVMVKELKNSSFKRYVGYVDKNGYKVVLSTISDKDLDVVEVNLKKKAKEKLETSSYKGEIQEMQQFLEQENNVKRDVHSDKPRPVEFNF